MENNNLIESYFNCPFTSREAVYDFIAQKIKTQQLSPAEIKAAFLEREAVGDLQIAPAVIMPHFENAQLVDSKIIIMHLKEAVAQWNPQIKAIKLIIVFLLKTNESAETKQTMIRFTRQLADEAWLAQLSAATEKTTFTQLLKIEN